MREKEPAIIKKITLKDVYELAERTHKKVNNLEHKINMLSKIQTILLVVLIPLIVTLLAVIIETLRR